MSLLSTGDPATRVLTTAYPIPIVFVVGVNAALHDGLTELIRAAGWRAETFTSSDELLSRPHAAGPNCLLLDFQFADREGLTLQQRLATERPEMPIIFLAGQCDVPMTVRAMKAGAIDVLTAPFAEESVLAAVRHGLQRSETMLEAAAELRALRQRHVTAGAALGHLDLALTLIRRASPELASLTAKYLVADARTSQEAYTIRSHLIHGDPLVHKFERWARQRLAEGFSLDQAAAALATSKRTLARRMQSVLGKSPLEYFQDLRVKRAVHLLETSHASVDQIAAEVGYAEGVTLRVLLHRKLGRGVREIRRSLLSPVSSGSGQPVAMRPLRRSTHAR
jgi:FixJ family two-component response regulator